MHRGPSLPADEPALRPSEGPRTVGEMTPEHLQSTVLVYGFLGALLAGVVILVALHTIGVLVGG